MLMGGGYADRMGRWRWSNNRMARYTGSGNKNQGKEKEIMGILLLVGLLYTAPPYVKLKARRGETEREARGEMWKRPCPSSIKPALFLPLVASLIEHQATKSRIPESFQQPLSWSYPITNKQPSPCLPAPAPLAPAATTATAALAPPAVYVSPYLKLRLRPILKSYLEMF